MDDLSIWSVGIVKIEKLLLALNDKSKTELSKLLFSYQQTKEAIAAESAKGFTAYTCSECAGKCCMNGKYRVNVLDLLTLILNDKTVIVNFMQKPLCPYGSQTGCYMQPAFRPADCILFFCDSIENKLSSDSRKILNNLEQMLREVIYQASHLTGESMGTPLLLWAEKVH